MNAPQEDRSADDAERTQLDSEAARLRAFIRRWDKKKTAEPSGENALSTFKLRAEFLGVANDLYPAMLEELVALRSRAGGSTTVSNVDGETVLEPAVPRTQLDSWLTRWNLLTDWCSRAADHTLLAWDIAEQSKPGQPIDLRWEVPEHTFPCVKGAPMEPESLEWDVAWETEADFRERIDEYIERRKRETFDAGYAQEPGGRGGPLTRTKPEQRLKMVAWRVVGGETYGEIAARFASDPTEDCVELTESAIQQFVGTLSDRLGLPRTFLSGDRNK